MNDGCNTHNVLDDQETSKVDESLSGSQLRR